jgi:hypothetical protein
VVVNDNAGSYAYGLPGGGPIETSDIVWRSALAGRSPSELDVRAWQRVDRTSWVLHDGDGLVLAEFVVDEQRQMGTQESSVDVRLMTAESHRVFAVVSDAIELFAGRAPERVVDVTTDALLVEGERPRPESTWPAASSAARVAANSSADSGAASGASTGSAVAGATALWVIRAALDVESLARSHVDPVDRDVKALSTLIGAGPFLIASHPEAAQQMQPMLADAISIQRHLAKRAYQQWAERKILSSVAAKTGRRSVHDVSPLSELVGEDHESDATGQEVSLSGHVVELRGLVLLLLEEDPTSAGSAVLLEVLRDALGGWLSGPRSLPKAIDSRRVVAVRCAGAALLAALEAEKPDGVSKGFRQRVITLDDDLRWIARRVALVETITRTAAGSGLTPGSMLTPDVWMDLGVLSGRTQRRMVKRLVKARRRATRLFRELGDVVETGRGPAGARR